MKKCGSEHSRKLYLTKCKRFYRKFYKIFYIIEVIPFTIDLIEITGQILSRIAPDNKYVKRAWKHWIMNHRPEYDDKLNFGKFIGATISEVPDDYISWLIKNCNPPRKLRQKLRILLLFNYDNLENFYTKGSSIYTCKYLVNLYNFHTAIPSI